MCRVCILFFQFDKDLFRFSLEGEVVLAIKIHQ
ncbi:MAG: hypothetical protein M2R46_02174 [Verrucomicrobia subdivision 3 bacterium]|nr:hypothetical protein [Limisphaerales bacterium]